jgi:DNA-binding beta-propeller fold protein YncE
VKRCLNLFAVLCLSLSLLPAASTSYVVLQKGANSLIRISSDGSSIMTIADGLDAQRTSLDSGLAIDSRGNYIVAAGSKLLSVTPSGAVSTLTEAPGDSLWTAVAVDAHGNLIVADGRKPTIWRVSPDGSAITKVATYDAYDSSERPVGVAVDSAGDYWVVVLDADPNTAGLPSLTRVYRISPDGVAREVRLHGVRSFSFSGGIAFDASGDLLFTDHRQEGLLRIAKDGEVLRLAPMSTQCGGMWGLARDTTTGAILATAPFCGMVIRSNPEGSGVETFTRLGKIGLPYAIAIESGR